MSQEFQKWVGQSLQLVDRIRDRFNKYFQIQQNERHSLDSSQRQPDLSANIQNQWRKLNELISKEIPQKQKNLDAEASKRLDVVKTEALRILNMFKSKFGEDKHNKFKLLQITQSWKTPILNSGIRKLGSETKSPQTTTRYELIPDEGESKAKSSIIIEEPEEEEQQIIKKLEESERRSYSRLQKEKAMQKRMKMCGYVLVCVLILALLMPYLNIPMRTALFKYLFQSDL